MIHPWRDLAPGRHPPEEVTALKKVLGFDPERLLTLRVNLSGEQYESAAAVRGFHPRALDRRAAVPGTAGAATINDNRSACDSVRIIGPFPPSDGL